MFDLTQFLPYSGLWPGSPGTSPSIRVGTFLSSLLPQQTGLHPVETAAGGQVLEARAPGTPQTPASPNSACIYEWEPCLPACVSVAWTAEPPFPCPPGWGENLPASCGLQQVSSDLTLCSEALGPAGFPDRGKGWRTGPKGAVFAEVLLAMGSPGWWHCPSYRGRVCVGGSPPLPLPAATFLGCFSGLSRIS